MPSGSRGRSAGSAEGSLAALPRRLYYTVAAALLAAGAPLGLLVVRLVAHRLALAGLRREIADDLTTYAYVTLSTIVVFSMFGYALGRQADTLLRLSRTDALTGLPNPRASSERFEAELARAARYREPLSLLLVDVDGLKAMNDGNGHRAGDLALQAVARAMRTGARQTDLAARLGGDEFALLAPSTPRPAAVALGERIRSLVAEQGVAGLTVSVGVVTADHGNSSAAATLRETADGALYEAKRQGRNRVVSAAAG
jgi:diguanylate cyclase (GGDEF)-like protein